MPTTTTAEREQTAVAPVTPSEAARETNVLNEKYAQPFDDSQIVKYGEAGGEVLRRVADEVKFVDRSIRATIAEMGDLMYRAHGVGLAAPQVGKSIRLFVYDAGDGLKALINPKILKMKGEQFEPEEGCLSIPGLRGVVRRAREITVHALDENGRPVRFRATDFEARVIQHENDHLDGVLFIDRADPSTLHMLSAEEQEQEHREVVHDGDPSDNAIPPAE